MATDTGRDASGVTLASTGPRYAILRDVTMEERRQARTHAERKAISARELMRAAVELIAERGWERSSSADIARRAGYSSTMVNARYGSRDGLLKALLLTYEDRFEAGGSPRGNGLAELTDRVEILREQVRSDPETLRAFLMLWFEAVGPTAEHRSWIEAWFVRYLDGLTKIIERGQADGSIRKDIDARGEARSFFDAGIGICYSWLLHPDPHVDSELVGLCGRTERLLGIPG